MHDVLDELGQPRAQTGAQWAVRWHAVVLFALLLGLVPLLHIFWHVVLGNAQPIALTSSYVAAPELNARSVLDGSWMKRMDRHLREASPAAVWLRGAWNEMLFLAGVPQSANVHFGHAGWMFATATLQPDDAELQRRSAMRREMFKSVKLAVEQAGAQLVVAVVPDKARIYPEYVADPHWTATKGPQYVALLAELHELGIVAPDLATALRAGKGSIGLPLYFQRDTHWQASGALVAGQAIAAAIAGLPLREPLRAPMVVRIATTHRSERLGDLAASAGLLSLEQPGERRWSRPASAVTRSLLEDFETYRMGALRDGTVAEFSGEEADGEVVLAGTSFSHDGSQALRLALQRPVFACIRDGADGIASLREVLRKLPELKQAKVVVWEIVERGFWEEPWRAPKL